MSDFIEALVEICHVEYGRFEEGRRGETDDPQYLYVGEYWRSIGIRYDGRTQVRGARGKMFRPAWSSAYISFVVRKAGAGDRFKYTQAHCHYTAQAMLGDDGYGYLAERAEEYSPQVGDIVVAGREYARDYNYDVARAVYEADSFYPSHGDIVIDADETTLTVIGGNVDNSVKTKRFGLDRKGRLLPRRAGNDEMPWIAVLRCRL